MTWNNDLIDRAQGRGRRYRGNMNQRNQRRRLRSSRYGPEEQFNRLIRDRNMNELAEEVAALILAARSRRRQRR